jgi:cyanophycin synthetase
MEAEAQPQNDMHGVVVHSIRALRGPNLYAYMPVLQIRLDIGPHEECPSDSFPGFVDRLTAWLPGLDKHECSEGHPGGFIERLHRGTYLAHIAEHITLELQQVMGFDVTFGRSRAAGARGVYNVVIAYREEEPAREAFHTALRLTLAAMHDEPFDAAAEIERLVALAERHQLGPSTAAIVAAAQARSIPVLRVTPTASLIQLGYGVYQKRIRAAETSNTSAIAVDICQEKPLTNHLLRTVGVPVPEGRVVKSADEAWEVAQEVGLSVVVKPEAGNQGKGVSIDLTSEAEVRAAYAIANQYRGDVLVEQYIRGADYRLLVVGGQMVAAARRDPAQVVGDGQHTVLELVAGVNRDPRRREGHSSSLTRIRLDDSVDLVLSQQGLHRESVPDVGQMVAELAAQILALDVAGVDVLCNDIRQPLREQGGAIVEVNAAPGLRMHLAPSYGKPRNVAVPIVGMLYPGEAPSRIPIIAITGTNGKTTVTRLVRHMYETARYVVGMTSTEGTFIDGERIMAGDCSGPKSARTVLLHPRVQVAVLETARGGILREGLAFDWCSVGVVTNVSGDHLGLAGINSTEDLARVKQVVIENVHRSGAAVLNADDPLVAEMAAATDARVVYFSTNARHPIVTSHLEQGGSCAFIDHGRLVLARDGVRNDLVDLERIPFTAGGRIRFQVQNALAAAAAAWAAGLNPAMIARALRTFSTDHATVPGRFNLSELHGVQIVLDYGHNMGALQALGEAVEALGARRSVMLLALPGDRLDADLAASVDATVGYVDEYVLYDSADRRGRAPLEVPRIMQERVPPTVPSTLAASRDEGIREAWRRVRPGDRLILIADEVQGTLECLHGVCGIGSEDSGCRSPITSEVRVG